MKNKVLGRILIVGILMGLSMFLLACGKSENDESESVSQEDCDHSFGAWETVKEATCTEKGEMKRVCEKCQYEETKTISKVDHKEVIDAAVEPTCTESGKTEGSHCEVCGKILVEQEEIEAGHSFSDENVEVTKEATCEEAGEGNAVCTVCGETVKVTRPALGHSANEEFICERCGKELPHEYELSDDEVQESKKVTYLGGDYSVQIDDEENTLDILFSLMDEDEERIAATVIVEVRIVNEDGETVYTGAELVKSDEFSTWSNALWGDRLMGSVIIPLKDIKEGTTSEGTVYFKVFNSLVEFEETGETTYELPKKTYEVVLPDVPLEVSEVWFGTKSNSCKITSINVEKDDTYMTVTFSGEKTYDSDGKNNNAICEFCYKVLDSEGTIVASGTVWTDEFCVGDKFKNQEFYVDGDFEPDETYTLKIFNSEY